MARIMSELTLAEAVLGAARNILEVAHAASAGGAAALSLLAPVVAAHAGARVRALACGAKKGMNTRIVNKVNIIGEERRRSTRKRIAEFERWRKMDEICRRDDALPVEVAATITEHHGRPSRQDIQAAVVATARGIMMTKVVPLDVAYRRQFRQSPDGEGTFSPIASEPMFVHRSLLTVSFAALSRQ